MTETLTFDFDNMKVGEISLFELTIITKMREHDLLEPGVIPTFDDVMVGFRHQRGNEIAPRVYVPMGFIMQAAGLVQLRRSNPDATWEEAGQMEMEVRPPKGDPSALVAAAETAATLPEDPLRVIEEASDPTTLRSPLPNPETSTAETAPTTTTEPQSGLSEHISTPS